MSARISVDWWAMNLADCCKDRSTCLRRSVGCVLLDADNHVIATGYNGVAAGMPHCNEPVMPGDICKGCPPDDASAKRMSARTRA